MPLYAVLARAYFGPRIIVAVLSATGHACALGISFGPLAGGWVFDGFGSHAWMFIGSSIVGFGAVEMSFAVPPQPRRAEQ